MYLAVVIGLIFLSIESVACQAIAFSAGLTSDTSVPGNTIVKFRSVILNQGNAYDSSTGIFKAPKNGVYFFNINTLSYARQEAWLKLYKNQSAIISAFSFDSTDFSTGGNSVILKLQKGDTIYVMATRDAALFGRDDNVYVTFNGYFIGS